MCVPGLVPPVRLTVSMPPVGWQQSDVRVRPVDIMLALAPVATSWVLTVPETVYERLADEKLRLRVPLWFWSVRSVPPASKTWTRPLELKDTIAGNWP